MPRKPKPKRFSISRSLTFIRENWPVLTGGIAVISFIGALTLSDWPPLASIKRVELLAQSQTEILKHESVTDHELLELRLRECKRDRTDAEIALSIHPDSRTDKNAQDDANDCIHTLGKLLTKPNS